MDSYTEKIGQPRDLSTENRGKISDLTERASERVSELADRYTDNEPKPSARSEHREGRVARAIEQQTAKLPSDAFLWAAVGSMGLSLALEIMGEERKANFVGHWAPTLLIFGLYNKIVKLQGSDGV
jgi:hypothetical protein